MLFDIGKNQTARHIGTQFGEMYQAFNIMARSRSVELIDFHSLRAHGLLLLHLAGKVTNRGSVFIKQLIGKAFEIREGNILTLALLRFYDLFETHVSNKEVTYFH